MNAADQRRLSPWLAGVCVVLVLGWAVLVAGIGRGVRWDAPAAAQALPSARHDAGGAGRPELKRYAEVWQRPLFTTDRRPVPVSDNDAGADANLDDLRLTGVILAPGMRMALLSDASGERTLRVAEGSQVASGDWVLKTLKPRGATFAGHGQVVHLELKVAPASSAATAESAATAPREAPPPEPPPDGASANADKARVKSLRDRIKQRRQHAAQAGER